MTIKSKYQYGIEFNGHRSNDFGLDVQDKTVGMPEKNKITQAIPFSNTVLDISDLYGGQTYKERTVKITFIVRDGVDPSKERLYSLWTQVVNWLMAPGRKVKLKDDIMHNYYYLAEVEKEPSWDEMRAYGKLSVEFNCYPFRIDELEEGNDIWDEFNFELDIAQVTDFEIVGSRTITLFNMGVTTISPEVVATAPFTIEMGGQRFTLNAGTYSSPDFMLPTGEVAMTVIGTGKLSFNWHKELI